MADNASDRKDIRRKEKQALIDEASRAAVVRNLMSTLDGRAWVWHHLTECHIFATSFRPDPLVTAFAEGERNVGLRLLLEVMSACPDQYLQAQREANERSALDERRSSPQPDGRDHRPVDTADSSAEGGGDTAVVDPDPDGVDAAIQRLQATHELGRLKA